MSEKNWIQALFGFEPIPFENNDKLDNIPHPPITTKKGRVVYNRKRHEFTQKDVLRVSGAVFNVSLSKNPTASQWMQLLEQITIWMLDKILETVTQKQWDDAIASALYYLFRNSLAKFIDRLEDDLKNDLADYVDSYSGGAH